MNESQCVCLYSMQRKCQKMPAECKEWKGAERGRKEQFAFEKSLWCMCVYVCLCIELSQVKFKFHRSYLAISTNKAFLRKRRNVSNKTYSMFSPFFLVRILPHFHTFCRSFRMQHILFRLMLSAISLIDFSSSLPSEEIVQPYHLHRHRCRRRRLRRRRHCRHNRLFAENIPGNFLPIFWRYQK